MPDKWGSSKPFANNKIIKQTCLLIGNHEIDNALCYSHLYAKKHDLTFEDFPFDVVTLRVMQKPFINNILNVM